LHEGSNAGSVKTNEMPIPMQRFGKTEEYGYLSAFLASEYASNITVTNRPIDGGLLRSAD
jgi:3-oxoacyl-[acyl-carrier protein] reductase